ncbi:MAG: hypothetical protein MUD14_22905 [Hydrococcus sp. Prado102]|jgi:hypothetical protein|nr:hypothetical protein [Hydrococcus sp. Prado102]
MTKKLSNIAIAFLFTSSIAAGPVFAQRDLDRPSFFRDGQQMIEQEIQRLEQQNSARQGDRPSSPLTIDSRQLQWQKFIFRDGGFSLWMPQGMQSEETVMLDTTVGEVEFKVFATHPKPYRFLAAYSNQLDRAQNQETLLDSIRDGIIAKTNFKLNSDRAITWGQYSGKQLNLQGEDETITYRVYLIGQRIYLLAVGQKNTEEVSSEAVNFFDSFQLLE